MWEVEKRFVRGHKNAMHRIISRNQNQSVESIFIFIFIFNLQIIFKTLKGLVVFLSHL